MTREEAIIALERISEDTVQRDCSTCGRHTAGTYNGVCCYCSLCQVVPDIFKDYHERKHFRSHWKWNGEWKNEALDMAIAALREQEERSKGCEYCRESENIYYHAGEVNALDEILYITGDDLVVDIGCRFYLAASIKFCPMCGRRLEEV